MLFVRFKKLSCICFIVLFILFLFAVICFFYFCAHKQAQARPNLQLSRPKQAYTGHAPQNQAEWPSRLQTTRPKFSLHFRPAKLTHKPLSLTTAACKTAPDQTMCTLTPPAGFFFAPLPQARHPARGMAALQTRRHPRQKVTSSRPIPRIRAKCLASYVHLHPIQAVFPHLDYMAEGLHQLACCSTCTYYGLVTCTTPGQLHSFAYLAANCPPTSPHSQLQCFMHVAWPTQFPIAAALEPPAMTLHLHSPMLSVTTCSSSLQLQYTRTVMPAAALGSPPHARMKDPFTGPFKREGKEAMKWGGGLFFGRGLSKKKRRKREVKL